MKKHLLLSITTGALLLTSCGQTNTSYNQTAVGLYDRFIAGVSQDMDVIGNSNIAKDKATAAVNHMEQLTDSCLTVMKGLKPTDDAKEFHAAELEVYNHLKTSFVPASRAIANAHGSEDAYNNAVDAYNNASTKLDELENKALAAQQAFASKAGMQIR